MATNLKTHTAEPWRTGSKHAHRNRYIYKDGAEKFLTSCMSEEDARRIVACVNALAGLPTEALEIFGSLSSNQTRLLALAGACRGRAEEERV